MAKAIDKKNDSIKCRIKGCDKMANHETTPIPLGDNTENRALLRDRLMSVYGIKTLQSHPLSAGWRLTGKSKNGTPTKHWLSAQGHHLICCEALDDDDWADICITFGYDLNHKKNGVVLPCSPKVACDLFVPLHSGNHADTVSHTAGINYVDAVKNLIEPIKAEAMAYEYCKGEKDLIEQMNKKSERIWRYLKSFVWTLTSDGKTYKAGGPGCGGIELLSERSDSTDTCSRIIFGMTVLGMTGTSQGHGYRNRTGYFKERE